MWLKIAVLYRWEIALAPDRVSDAEVIRSMIEHEGDLLNHRITWMVTLQGLLFTALGFAWDKEDAFGLIWVFGIVGIVISISSGISFRAATRAERRLLDWWNHNKGDYNGPDVVGLHAPNSILSMLYPWRVLPIVFVLAWLGVLWFNGKRPSLEGLSKASDVSASCVQPGQAPTNWLVRGSFRCCNSESLNRQEVGRPTSRSSGRKPPYRAVPPLISNSVGGQNLRPAALT